MSEASHCSYGVWNFSSVRKIIFCQLILLFCTALNAYAQTDTNSESEINKNTIALLLDIIGAEGYYERHLNDRASLLINLSYNYSVTHEYTASLAGRFYLNEHFYADLGLGYINGRGMIRRTHDALLFMTFLWVFWPSALFNTSDGLLIQPAIGFKVPFADSKSVAILLSIGTNIKVLSTFPDFSPYCRLGIGYSF